MALTKDSKRARCVDHQLRTGCALLYEKKPAVMVCRIGIDVSNDTDRCIFEELDTDNEIAEIEN